VQVALDPSALGVPRVDDPPLRCLDLDEARPPDSGEAGVRQCEPGGRREAADERTP